MTGAEGRGRVTNRIRKLREAAGLTQAELADRVGATRQTIIAIEKGKFGPTVGLALALARVLKVSVEDLFWLVPDD